MQIEQITEFLVKSGANINAVNYTTGSTPLMNAIWSRYIRTALKLIELGADTTIVNHEGLTALELAKKDDISHCANATRSAAEVIKAIEAHIKKRK